MKTLIIYNSKTGFTQRYAEWIARNTQGDLLPAREAKKKDSRFFQNYDAIIYGSWVMAESVVGIDRFLKMASEWKDKRLAVFCVGASPNENPDIEQNLHKLLTDEQRTYIQAFYCQGGLNYDRMNAPSRLAMKALCAVLKKKKDAT